MHKLNLNGEIPMNCYIIENNKECFIIDPGFQKEVIIEYVKNNNLNVQGILLTHGHFDHIGAIDCFNVPIYMHVDELQIFNNNDNNGYNPHKLNRQHKTDNLNIITITDGHVFILGGKEITTISTPGHTIGGVCYFDGENLYTGDTLFKQSIGKWTFPTGDLKVLENSLIKLFTTITDDAVKVHPGHGLSSTIGEERNNNNFVNLALSKKLHSNYYK